MFSNRTFQAALLASVVTHFIIVSQSAGYLFFAPVQKIQKVEVNYIKTAPVKQSLKQGIIKPVGGRVEPFLKIPSKIGIEKRNPPPFMIEEEAGKAERQVMRKNLVLDKPALAKPEIISLKKKITLPQVDIAKIDNPSYLSYYQIVREKIRRAAYQNYTRNDTGEVYVTFVISNDGHLKDVHLVEEKSSAKQYLKDIALASVKNASPFPNFPKELDYPQVPFNVVISFEIE